MNDATAYFRESLKGLASIAAGYPFRGAVDALPSGDVAVIQMGNANPEVGVDWMTTRRVELPSKRSANFLAPGDVIFTTRGTRNYALALDAIPGLAVCSPHFFVMRVNDQSCILPAFLAWQINQRPAQEYFQREATGSYILNIRREVIENLPLVIPPLEQQNTIVALAHAARAERVALAKLIENRNHQIEAIALSLHHSPKNPYPNNPSEGLNA
jgi:Type I restriction modification DNA specificity domain